MQYKLSIAKLKLSIYLSSLLYTAGIHYDVLISLNAVSDGTVRPLRRSKRLQENLKDKDSYISA